ncbi:hypothetical protein FDUTEX481_06533 [Tolypothrix sp. PCC 7601]|nr:hypothetical protein FDUTEX481_06533 [Tolypothrix sp. PCC 7601]
MQACLGLCWGLPEIKLPSVQSEAHNSILPPLLPLLKGAIDYFFIWKSLVFDVSKAKLHL